MYNRTFWVILAGGVLVSAAGYLPLMAYVPSVVVPGWEGIRVAPPVALGLAGLALALLVLTGLASGWLSGAPTCWGALGAGALAGMLAALVAETLFGGVAAGLWGARNLLAHGLTPAKNMGQYILLLAESVQSITLAAHVSMVASALAGALLGGLGGMLSRLLPRSFHPAKPVGPAVHLMALAAASFNLIEVIVVYFILPKSVQNALDEYALSLPYPTSLIFSLPTGVALLWWLFWLGMAGGMGKWTPSSQRFTGFKALGWSVLGWLIAPSPFILARISVAGGLPNMAAALLVLLIMVGVPLLIIVLAVWLAGRVSPGFRARVRGFLQRAGEARLMSGMALGIAALTAVLALASIPDAWRQPWFSGGMVLGLVLALWGVWAARAAPSPVEEAALRTGDLFATSGLGALCANLTLMLTTLAPLAMAQIPIGMLIYLAPERPSPAGEFSSVLEVAESFMGLVPVQACLFVLVLPLLTGLVSVLLRWLWGWVMQRLGRERTRPV